MREIDDQINSNVRDWESKIQYQDPESMSRQEALEYYQREADEYEERRILQEQQRKEQEEQSNLYEENFGENLFGDKIQQKPDPEYEQQYEEYVQRDTFWKNQKFQQSVEWIPQQQDPQQRYYQEIKEMQLADRVNKVQAQFQEEEIVDDQPSRRTGILSDQEQLQTIETNFTVHQKSILSGNLNPRMTQFVSNLQSLQNAKNLLI